MRSSVLDHDYLPPCPDGIHLFEECQCAEDRDELYDLLLGPPPPPPRPSPLAPIAYLFPRPRGKIEMGSYLFPRPRGKIEMGAYLFPRPRGKIEIGAYLFPRPRGKIEMGADLALTVGETPC